MRVLTPEEKAEEAHMMQERSTWPMFPFLPVKRRKPDGGFPDCAIMSVFTGYDVVVASLDDVLKDPKAMDVAERFNFKTAAEAVEAGWVVD